MKRHVLSSATCCLTLAFALPAFAEEWVVVETYCFDDTPSDGQFHCAEGRRRWAAATNLDKPQVSPDDPNGWPTSVHNYLTQYDELPTDKQRCVNDVHERPQFRHVPEDDIFVGCFATVFYVAPYLIATGTRTVGFGDPMEWGEYLDDNGALVVTGVLAEVQAIDCSCIALVDGPE